MTNRALRPVTRRRYACIATGIFLAAMMAGCGLFDTRDPESPNTGSATFTPPTSPDIVIENLRNAITERNESNYIRCMPDTLSTGRSFSFLPTASAAARYASVFTDWSLASEKAYFAALAALTPSSAVSSLTLNGRFTLLASDSAVYQGDYTLVFPHGIGGTAETVQGNLQFVLAPDRTSIWSIVRWIDSPEGNLPSWSELKGRFAN